MTEVLFFSYHNTAPWWQYLADNLTFTKSAAVISDLRGETRFCIVDDFYKNLREDNCEQKASTYISPLVCDDIIRRCRVLRNLNKSTALSMIGAMWIAFDDLIKKEKPKLVMSFIIDRYVLDVLDRVLKIHSVPFVGMTASIMPDYVMFMDRGKLIPFRKPDLVEVETSRKQLINDSFAPSYVSRTKKYTRSLYWRTFLYYKIRGVAFQCIRYLKRDKLNLHYLDALNNLQHKPRLLDYKVLNYLNQDWADKLLQIEKNKRVFLALQLLPEASIDYWLDSLDLLNNEEFVLKVCKVLGKADFTVFIKDHPLQFGFRKRELIQQLAKLPYVVIVPYDASAMQLIKECAVTVTCTGTIGFQSVLAGTCSIVSNAYYSDEENFIHFNNLKDVESLPEKIALFQASPSEQVQDQTIDNLITKVLAASARGDLFTFKRFNKYNSEHIERIKPLLDSLNKYLPHIMETHKQA